MAIVTEPYRIRLLRGQVVVREDLSADSRKYEHIYVPQGDDRSRTWHRGTVLAKGEPAQVSGVDVPHGFDVGDVVIFHWSKNERAFTRPWTDGENACWLAQEEIDAVVG